MPPYLGPRSGSHRMKTRFHVLILVLILFSSHTPFSFISASRTQTSSSPRKRISTPISPPLHNDILFQIHSHLHSTRDKLNLRLARYSYALESTSQTLRLRNFSSFRNAVKRGDEDAVNKFYGYWATGALNANIYRHGRLMLLAKHCDAFRQAAAKGYTKILQKLWNWASSPQGTITTPPACSPLQMNMLTSLGFQAFQRAVISPLNNISATNHNPYSSTAHLLWSWAAKCNVRDEMLSAKDYEAFHAVIAHGNTAMARLMHGIWCREVSSVIQSPSLSSTSCARMLSSRLFGASILAVTHNHPHLLSLLHTWAKSYNLNAQQLAADSFDSFVTAAELGHVRMLREWACEVDLEVQEEEGGAGGVTMANEQIEAGGYEAFIAAAEGGHVEIVELIWSWASSPQQQYDMLMEDDGEAFVRAVPMIKHVMMEMDHEDDDVATYTTSTSSNQLHETDIMIKLLWWFALELHLSGFIPLPPIPDGDDHQQEPIINNPKPSTSSSSSSSGDIIPFIRTDIPSNTSSLHTQLITAQDFMAFRRACLAGNIQIMTTLLTWAAGSQHLVDKMIEAQGLGCLEWALNSRWFTNKPDIFQAVFQVVWNFSSSIETKHRIQKWVAQHIDNHH